MESKREDPSLSFYTAPMVNPYKISIALEELRLTYNMTVLDITKKEQKSDWFTAINPNGRIPALTDRLPDGTIVKMTESASILIYLTDKYDPEHKLNYPYGTKKYYEVLNWLTFQVSAIGPMQGQATHFVRYSYEKAPYSELRYLTETRRLYNILDKHLASQSAGYLVGEKFTIADIACFVWVYGAAWSGLDVDIFPAIKTWLRKVAAREYVQRGLKIPSEYQFSDDYIKSSDSLEFRQRLQALGTESMKRDQEDEIRQYHERSQRMILAE